MTPTPEQLSILSEATSPDSLMISALAGTGKTTTLVMLAKQLPPVPSLALAFNKKIAKELEERFPSNFSIKTMNGLGHSAWGKTLRKKLFLDDKKLGRLVTTAFGGEKVEESVWTGVRQLVSRAMQRGLVPSSFVHYKSMIPDTPEVWEDLADELDLDLTPAERKVARGVLISSIEEALAGKISFDDQIYMPVMFNGDFPRFHTVLVDEAQDLSPLNHRMLRRVCSDRLIVVGDPHQAIYAFRGADSSSMQSLRALRSKWIDLPLNTTFRCPQLIVDRQKWHVPNYTAAEGNAKGVVLNWSGRWDWALVEANLPKAGAPIAVLCRNNAPLLTLALKLIKSRIPVAMLGRDIGKGLVATLRKISPDRTLPIAAVSQLIENWRESQVAIATANKKEEKIERINDKADCFVAVIEGASPATGGDLFDEIEALFARDVGRVTLATGHRSKGLEWDCVIHLDPWRIPSRSAKSPSKIQQEHNLLYVIETRTKHTLILAAAKNFE